MATSGTTDFNLDILDIVDEAYALAGHEGRTGYDMKSARRSLDILMKEWGNRGINYWTIKESSSAISAGQTQVTLDADTIDIIDATWRTGTGQDQNDRQMTRMSVTDWATMANKNTVSAKPSQFYVNRVVPPVVQLWPVPSEAGTFVYWKIRKIEDVGAYTNTMDVPSRFIPAMIAGLAYKLAIKLPQAQERIPVLKLEYNEQFEMAANEDRDRTSMRLIPGRSC